MKMEFTTGEETESKDDSKKKVLSGEELGKQLDRLLQDKANNQRIRDWVEANLEEQQAASNQFVRALMTSVCQAAIICDNRYRVDARQMNMRASLLQKYLCDEQKELQALYALQALMVHMEQPANLLRMFFDALFDEDVIKEEAFYKWESSKDPAEQTGKGVALKSVTAFFTWLREEEEESDKKMEFTTGEETESKEVSKKKVLSGEELGKQLDRLLQDKANNQQIRDWVEANLEEQQAASNQFVRTLMTSVCQAAIICDNPYRVDARQMNMRASLLQKYLCDEQKELQALYALQALMVHMAQPANLLRMFFDALYDEDIIKEEAFYKWESSKDPAEQTGKGVALRSVTAFFIWLHEAEEESDNE